MKKTIFPLFIFVLLHLFFASTAQAQLPATTIETLILDMWPDYDHPSVLVLMTGTLPAATPLPATVTLPITPGAEINAVARITADNQMFDDVPFATENDTLTFTTPDPRFRVEYYAPYQKIGNLHTFSFDWLADIAVARVLTAVQQPTGATNMAVTPANADVVSDTTDGFTYYTFPPAEIPAGQLFTITFNYDMVTPQLSIENLPSEPAAVINTANAPSSSTTERSSLLAFLENINVAYIIGLVGIVLLTVVATWQIATHKTRPAVRKKRKPQPKRPSSVAKAVGKARFCHECGHKLQADDRFCRECGTAVKGL